MKEIKVGESLEIRKRVTESLLAKNVGSGDVAVYATPMMLALMEETASKCLAQFLDEGETSVGTYIASSHDSATPLGMEVCAKAKIVGAEGKKVDFEIEAFDEKGSIGKGTHSRFVLNRERFEKKASEKGNS